MTCQYSSPIFVNDDVLIASAGIRRLIPSDRWGFYECINLLGGGFPRPESISAAAELIDQLNAIEARSRVICWAVVDSRNTYRGHIVLDRNAPPNHGHASIGIWIDPMWQRRGFGTSALTKALAETWRKDPQIQRIDAVCLPENRAARRVLAKTGFNLLATLVGQQLVAGTFRDMELWSQTARKDSPLEMTSPSLADNT